MIDNVELAHAIESDDRALILSILQALDDATLDKAFVPWHGVQFVPYFVGNNKIAEVRTLRDLKMSLEAGMTRAICPACRSKDFVVFLRRRDDGVTIAALSCERCYNSYPTDMIGKNYSA